MEIKKFFLVGGALQVLITTLAGFLIAQFFERPLGESIFLGFILSLSSSAIILRLYEEKQEMDTPHGRVVIGISIFQDIIAIPMILLTPYLGKSEGHFDFSFLLAIGKGMLILGIVYFLAVWIIPKLLYYITRTRSRELFLITVLMICASVAWVAGFVGLSLSFGAFLAGIILSDSEYRHQAVGDILPFQDIFTSFFFLSIGMLLDIQFVLSQPFLILAMALGVLLLKGETFGGYQTSYQFVQFILHYCQFILDEWKAGHTLSGPVHLMGIDQINPHSTTQFTKPIVLLINHLDFSGGDFFPAIMQDNKRALIVGTKTAGAGGYVSFGSFPNRYGSDFFRLTGSIAYRVNQPRPWPPI
ncbi:hypothetical protein BH09BAC6_BH09BAC6_05030 [soil metagenome]